MAWREIFGESTNAIISRMHDRIAQLNQIEKAVKQKAAENERSTGRRDTMAGFRFGH